MSQSKEDARDDPHSLAPIAISGTNDDQDLAKMRSGSGLRIAFAVLVAAAAIVGGAQLLKSMDTRQAYASAAAAVERTDADQREAFMRCVLPNYQRSQAVTGVALRSAIETQSERMEKNYAKQLAKCTPLMASFQQAITDIKAPADVTQQVEVLNKSVNDLGIAWNSYREFLLHASAYDASQAAPLVEAIGNSWQGYLTAREQAKQVLSAKL